jgi:hypothetical protein
MLRRRTVKCESVRRTREASRPLSADLPTYFAARIVSEMNFVAFNAVDRRLIHPDGVPLIGFIY